MNKEELIKYWINSSDRDFQAMMHLLEKVIIHGHYLSVIWLSKS